MQVGIGVSITNNPRLAIAASVASEVAFGALTLAGAGAVDAPAGATSMNAGGTNLAMSGGKVSPATAGVTSGTVTFDNGVEWTITAEANTYSATTGELAAILNLGSATIDGKTVKGRPGADIGATTAGSSTDFVSSLAFTTGLTITSHDAANPAFMRRIFWRHDGSVTLQDITVRDDFVLSDLFGNAGVMRFTNPGASARSQVTMTRVESHGGNVDTIDTSTVVSGTAAASSSGTTTITFSDSPDLSAVATDRSMMIRVGTNNRVITGVDNTAKTVTVSSAVTASSLDYVICYTPQILRIIGQDGGIANAPDLTMADCNLHDYDRSITGTYRALDVQDTVMDRAYADHVSMSTTGTETKLDFLNNRIGRAYGTASDPLNPHVDGIQLNLGPMTQQNATAYRFIGNVFFGGPNGRARDAQGIFLENGPSGTNVLVDIQHNVLMTAARNAISVEQPASGSIIAGNTLLYDNAGIDASPLVPYLMTVTGTYPTQDSGVIVKYNAVPNISFSSASLIGNHQFGTAFLDNEGVDYAALFAGASTAFNSTNLADFAALLTAATPDNATLTPTGSTPIGALHGYYNYDTGVDTAPWNEAGWAASGLWGDVTGATTDATVNSSLRQVTGVGANGVSIHVTGGTSPTLTLYDTDGTTVIVSGVTEVLATANQYVRITDTASGTGSTTATVTINAGKGASGTWEHTTAAAGYAINTVEFDGTNDWLHQESGYTGAGGTQLIMSMNLYFPTAWPGTAVVLSTATAGGTEQVRVATASDGRLSFVLRDGAATVIANYTTGVGTFLADTWYTIIFAFDSATDVGGSMRIRPSGGAWSAPTWATSSFTVGGVMDAVGRARFGAANSSGGSLIPQSYWGDVYLRLGQTLDLSVTANLDKFLPTTDKGADGSTPTGSIPQLYLSGSTATWHTNKGSGGGLTLTGALTDAPSDPV